MRSLMRRFTSNSIAAFNRSVVELMDGAVNCGAMGGKEAETLTDSEGVVMTGVRTEVVVRDVGTFKTCILIVLGVTGGGTAAAAATS